MTATGSTDFLLSLESVDVTYDAVDGGRPVVVLEDFVLSVSQGDFVALAGRSGSGKTTALRVAAGLLRPGGGHVRWNGQAIEGWLESDRDRARGKLIGYVFQSGGLIPTLTAAENVAVPALARGASRLDALRARELLTRVGIAPGRAGNIPAKLSGGEQQRVGLARALFSDPPLLLIDEPTANLDRSTADGIISLLVQLHVERRAIVVATHDQELIQTAERVVRLE